MAPRGRGANIDPMFIRRRPLPCARDSIRVLDPVVVARDLAGIGVASG